MAKLPYRKLWEKVKTSVFMVEGSLLAPEANILHRFDSTVDTACVSMLDVERKKYLIKYGKEAITDVINDLYITKDRKEKYRQVLFLNMFYFYHEVAHVLYTDMTLNAIKRIGDKVLASYAANLNNILEDAYIQYRRMAVEYPYTKNMFLSGDNKMFRSKVMNEYTDEGDLGSIFTYLLYSTRRGKVFKGNNKFVTKHKDKVSEWVSKFLNEHDAPTRAQVAVDFLNWMLSTGDVTLPKKEDEKGVVVIKSSWDEDVEKKPAEDIEGVIYTPEGLEGTGESKSYEELRSEDEDYEYSEDEMTARVKKDILDDPYDFSMEDYDHRFIDLKGHTDDWSEIDEDDKARVNSIAKSTTKVINIKLERERPRYMGGRSSGRLDIPAVISRSDGNVFRQKIKAIPQPKLAFSILMDNSGSIKKNQSYTSSIASLALAKACESLEIPVEVNAFTSLMDRSYVGNEWITWEVKTFEDSYKSGESNIGNFMYRQRSWIEDLPMFNGNMEEINIAHLANRFTNKYPEEKKVMIVLCDGVTTGSEERLKKVVETISKDMYVIGIGLQADLGGLYENTFSLMSKEEVDDLPNLMSNILKKFVIDK